MPKTMSMTKKQLEQELHTSFEVLFNKFMDVYKDKTLYHIVTRAFEERPDGEIGIPWEFAVLIWTANSPTVAIERLQTFFPGLQQANVEEVRKTYSKPTVTAPTTSVLSDADVEADLFGADTDDDAELQLQMEEIDVISLFENTCRKKRLTLTHEVRKKKRALDRELAILAQKKGAEIERLVAARARLGRPKQ